MVRLVSAASIAAYMASLIRLKGKYLEQQVAFLIIYLAGLTVIGEMDVLLPIYFVISLLPFLKYIRKISIATCVIVLYFGSYLLYGIMFQDATGALVTFIAKVWQFVVFFIVYDANIKLKEEDYKKIIWVAVVTETLLGFYLLATSTNIDINGWVRLVSNAQPITGNISTVALPISVYYYFKNREDSKRTRWLFIINIIMLAWIILSGTRGYTLEFGATMALIFCDYFTTSKVGKISQKNRFMLLVLTMMIMLAAIIADPTILEKLASVLRLKSSVGIRTYENAAIKEFIKNAPVLTAIFGIGIGGQGGSYSAMYTALSNQFSLGMWNKAHYINGSGAIFHNLYANVLLCLGILGIVVLVCINISIWKRVTYSCGRRIQVRRVMHLFQLSFLLMNYYRWSAVCGIAEMIVFALTLKILRKEKMNE